MDRNKEWRVFCKGVWVGYARAESRAEAIAKTQAKRPDLPLTMRWSAA